jgi:quinol monooxygenase YgiN
MLGLQIRVRMPQEKRREFLQAIDFFSSQLSGSEACIQKKLFEDVGEQTRFLWVEHWTDSKSLEKYLRSDQFNSLLGAIDVLGELEDLHMIKLKSFPEGIKK